MSKISADEIKKALKDWKDLREFFPYTFEGLLKFANMAIYKKHKTFLTKIQIDILKTIWYSENPFMMVQAQRGQAKTTLTGILAVFFIINNPRIRIKIISAIAKNAGKILKEITDIIQFNDYLEVLRPNIKLGDRASQLNGYDVNRLLKGDGAERDATVDCLSLKSAAPSNRADIVIIDDIESDENAKTEDARQIIKDKFNAAHQWLGETGRVIVLGTPQSKESIYNDLPSKGYSVHIWPARYPSHEEEERYGGLLAEIIKKDLEKSDEGLEDEFGRKDLRNGAGIGGLRGKPTDPMFSFVNEKALIKKEVSDAEDFQLQQMLDTSLLDKDMYPLKVKNITFLGFGKTIPPEISYTPMPNYMINSPALFSLPKPTMYLASSYSEISQWKDINEVVMTIDPSGGGLVSKDETGFSIGTFLNTKLFVMKIGGIKGGYEQEQIDEILDLIKKYNVTTCIVENNYGNGALASMIQKELNNDPEAHNVNIEKPNVSGQKEVRIIERIAPWLGSHDLVFNTECLDDDVYYCQKHNRGDASTYSLFFQMDKITKERQCLRHDDRIDALSLLCDYFSNRRNMNVANQIEKDKRKEKDDFLKNYLTNKHHSRPDYSKPKKKNRFKGGIRA